MAVARACRDAPPAIPLLGAQLWGRLWGGRQCRDIFGQKERAVDCDVLVRGA